jgi:hypothetical protein
MRSLLKMKKWKLVLLILLFAFIILQFFRPEYNKGELKGENDIYHVVDVPDDVHEILVKACYDCHSNHTEYPWYSHIQPFGWWIAEHVEEGKEELNFSEFKSMKKKGKLHKLHETIEMIEEDVMPLESYLYIHSDAKLTPEEKEKVITWAEKAQKQILSEE